jgi:hypothetical protein
MSAQPGWHVTRRYLTQVLARALTIPKFPRNLTQQIGLRSNNLYLNGAWFKFGQDPERFFMGFLSPFQYPKLGYDCFVSYPFQFIIHCDPIIWQYMIQVSDSAII